MTMHLAPCACRPAEWLEQDDGKWWEDGDTAVPTYVKLMLDCCHDDNVWDSEGASHVLYALPVSFSLHFDIGRWSADHADMEGWLRGEYLYAENNPDYPLEWMNRRGAALADRLRGELGPEWTVDHQLLHRSGDDPVGKRGRRAGA